MSPSLFEANTSEELLPGETSEQDTNVVASFSEVERLVEGLNTSNGSFGTSGTITNDFDLVADFDSALLDSSGGDGSSAFNVVGAFDGHHEGLVDWPGGDRNVVVHHVEQLKDLLLSDFGLGVVHGMEGRAADELDLLGVVLVLLEDFLEFHFDDLDHLGVLDHVALIDEDDDGSHSDLL